MAAFQPDPSRFYTDYTAALSIFETLGPSLWESYEVTGEEPLYVDPEFMPDNPACLYLNAQSRRRSMENSTIVQQQGGLDIQVKWVRMRSIFQRPDDLLDKDFHTRHEYVETAKQYQQTVPWVVFHSNIHSPKSKALGGFASEISQGGLGNCWLMGSLAAIGEKDPGLLMNLFCDPISSSGEISPIGAYLVRLCDGGLWKYSILDDFFPCKLYNGIPVFSYAGGRGQQLWAPLIEKGFAKLLGCYERIEGGRPAEALRAVTGFPCIRLSCRNVYGNLASLTRNANANVPTIPVELLNDDNFDLAQVCAGTSNQMDLSTQEGIDDLRNPELVEALLLMWTRLQSSLDSHMIMTCSTKDNRAKLEKVGLLPNHCYSVRSALTIDIDEAGTTKQLRLLQMRNPWANTSDSSKFCGSYHCWDIWPPEVQARVREIISDRREPVSGRSASKARMKLDEIQDAKLFWISFEDFLRHCEEMTISLWRPNWYEGSKLLKSGSFEIGNSIGSTAGTENESLGNGHSIPGSDGDGFRFVCRIPDVRDAFSLFPGMEIRVEGQQTEIIVTCMQEEERDSEQMTDLGLVLYRKDPSNGMLTYVDSLERCFKSSLVLETMLPPGIYIAVPISVNQVEKSFVCCVFASRKTLVIESKVSHAIFRSMFFEHIRRNGRRLDIMHGQVCVFSERTSAGIGIFVLNGSDDDIELKSILRADGTTRYIRTEETGNMDFLTGNSPHNPQIVLQYVDEGEDIFQGVNYIPKDHAVCIQIAALLFTNTPYNLQTHYETRPKASRPGKSEFQQATGFGAVLFQPFVADAQLRHSY